MKTINVPEDSYEEGVITANFPGTQNGKFVALELEFTRVGWPSGVDYVKADGTVDHNVVLVARLEFSIDGGDTWQLMGEAPFVGGTRIDRNGNVILSSRCRFGFFQNNAPIPKTGQARAWFNVLVPLTTALTARAYEESDL